MTGLVGVGAGLVAAFAAGSMVAAAGRRRLRRKLAAAWRLACTDRLTGLPNRYAAEVILARLRRSGQPYAVVLLDLDGFKPVNDRHGHAAGDVVLVEVGRRLAGIVAGRDDLLVARLGGDEFVLIGPSPAPATSRLLGFDTARALSAPVEVAGCGDLVVRGSVGVVHALAGDDPARALHAADLALYRAKAAGGNTVVEHDPTAELPQVPHRPAVRLRELAPAARDLARAVT